MIKRYRWRTPELVW